MSVFLVKKFITYIRMLVQQSQYEIVTKPRVTFEGKIGLTDGDQHVLPALVMYGKNPKGNELI